ncbi:hypothetical protein [Pseudonocardia nigra]|uniref:hypothetical protein n=1 Tax=Pseudonocardia nigra TaxID=1921578 RepID=UPI001C5E15DC|nr:hypothetical protein [Pseudonocardia nigra]
MAGFPLFVSGPLPSVGEGADSSVVARVGDSTGRRIVLVATTPEVARVDLTARAEGGGATRTVPCSLQNELAVCSIFSSLAEEPVVTVYDAAGAQLPVD